MIHTKKTSCHKLKRWLNYTRGTCIERKQMPLARGIFFYRTTREHNLKPKKRKQNVIISFNMCLLFLDACIDATKRCRLNWKTIRKTERRILFIFIYLQLEIKNVKLYLNGRVETWPCHAFFLLRLRLTRSRPASSCATATARSRLSDFGLAKMEGEDLEAVLLNPAFYHYIISAEMMAYRKYEYSK